MGDKKIKIRTGAMEKLARRIDYSFEYERAMGISMFLSNFKLFKMGKNQPVYNVIYRKDSANDSETIICDYKYVVHTGKSSHTFRQTVSIFINKKFALPHFYMMPEKWYHRLGKIFGIDDIDFEEYPKFSRNYYLKGEDESFIRHTFDQEEILSLFQENTGYHLEGCNYVFILYSFNDLKPQDEILDMLSLGSKISLAYSAKGDSWLENHTEIMDIIKEKNSEKK